MLPHFDVANLAMWLVAFVLSTTCHEAAHALAGRLGGDSTADEQVTLNPLPHIRREPFGMVFVPLLSYVMSGWMMGWGSAPYDPYWAQRHPKRAALMAAAGPAANLVLAAVALVLMRAIGLGVFGYGPTVQAVRVFVWVLAVLNGILFVFNLLPLPPLDGASVLSGVGGVIGRAMQRLREEPMMGMIGLLVAWQAFRFIAPGLIGLLRRLAGLA